MENSELLAEEIEKSRELLKKRFASLEIEAPIVPYPKSKTVEEGKLLRGNMAGTFTKNLLLKDKKHDLYLLSVFEDQDVDLKTLHKRIGAHGRLGFAHPQQMTGILDVLPGSLTPLALINDDKNEVTAVIDASLMKDDQINFHPLINTESVGLHPQDFLKFLRSCGHEPLFVDFDADID